MNVGPWNECVLFSRPDGKIEFVSTAKQAAAILRDRWVGLRGPAFHSAAAACEEVMRKFAPTYVARVAFELALREAGIRR